MFLELFIITNLLGSANAAQEVCTFKHGHLMGQVDSRRRLPQNTTQFKASCSGKELKLVQKGYLAGYKNSEKKLEGVSMMGEMTGGTIVGKGMGKYSCRLKVDEDLYDGRGDSIELAQKNFLEVCNNSKLKNCKDMVCAKNEHTGSGIGLGGNKRLGKSKK